MKRPVVAHNGEGVIIMLEEVFTDGTWRLHPIPDGEYRMEIHEAMEFAGELLRASGDVLKERAGRIVAIAKKEQRRAKKKKEVNHGQRQ